MRIQENPTINQEKKINRWTLTICAGIAILIGVFHDKIENLLLFTPTAPIKDSKEKNGKQAVKKNDEKPAFIFVKKTSPPPPEKKTDLREDENDDDDNNNETKDNNSDTPLPWEENIRKLQEVCRTFLYEDFPVPNPYEKSLLAKMHSLLNEIEKEAIATYEDDEISFDLPTLCATTAESIDQRIDQWMVEIARSDLSVTEKFELFEQAFFGRERILKDWIKKKEIEALGNALENTGEESPPPIWWEEMQKARIIAGPGGFEIDPGIPKYEMLLEEKDFYKNIFAAMRNPDLDKETAEYLLNLWDGGDEQTQTEIEKEFGDEFEEVMGKVERMAKLSEIQKRYETLKQAMIEYKNLFEALQIARGEKKEDLIRLLRAKDDAYWAVNSLLIWMTTGHAAITPEEANIPYTFDQLYEFLMTFELTRKERDELLSAPPEMLIPN